MVQHFEATIEDGVLKPDEPLRFANRQRVSVTATDEPGIRLNVERKAEMEWLRLHAHEYRGQWVALDGDRLLASGTDGMKVFRDAQAQGVDDPLMYRPPDATGPKANFI